MKKIYFILLVLSFLTPIKGYGHPDILDCPILLPRTIELAIQTNRPVSDDGYNNTYWQIINHPPLGLSRPLNTGIAEPPNKNCNYGTCCTYNVYFEGMAEPYKIRFYLTEELSYLKRSRFFFQTYNKDEL